MNIQKTIPEELPLIRKKLIGNNLPADDLDPDTQIFYGVYDGDELAGFCAMEPLDDPATVFLFRSMVIDSNRRNAGIGKMLLNHVLKEYPGTEIYLLTESAAGFFRKHGFREIDRNNVPGAVKRHPQFSYLCPGSATGMKLKT